MIKVIYFDFFKVICDPAYTPVIQNNVPEDQQKDFFSKLDVLDKGDMHENELLNLISQVSKKAVSFLLQEVDTKPKIDLELMEYIASELKPRFKIGLLTNAPETLINRLFEKHLPVFDIVLISSKLRLIKPSKEIFEVAINEAKVTPEEILFIDDSKRNIESAHSLGINTILYTNFADFKKELQSFL